MAELLSGTKDIPSAGTAVQIKNVSRKVLYLHLHARTGNTNNVWFGDSTVAANLGKPIAANGTFTIEPGQYRDVSGQSHAVPFSSFYVDADTNGNDVEWVALVL
jgi:hypothetical protein|tara:strand:+ start:196 stop:507 length:312 start_codon:yes stop_codon:yes gene_type:complete